MNNENDENNEIEIDYENLTMDGIRDILSGNKEKKEENETNN